jgi:DNA-binding MarR family transcriptional regulator
MTDPTIRELLSYRLHQVANLLSRGAELRYRREFGVSLWEWRTVALLGGAREPQSLNDLARAAGMDKGQMSRVVSGLTGRKMVSRETDANDARGIRLSLTAPGRRLYQKLIRAAAERNSAFLGCLGAKERSCLDQAMAKLSHEARSFIQAEKQVKKKGARAQVP